MQFNVSSLLQEHTGATREYDLDDDIEIEGARQHVTGRARFVRTPDGVLVIAQMSGTMTGECSRCLKRLEADVNIAFEEEYIPTIDIDSGAAADPPKGAEEAFRISARHMLDLTEPIQQYWALTEPMAPLCDEACRGLCPICGQEVAGADHACTRDQMDARWTKLKDLKLG